MLLVRCLQTRSEGFDFGLLRTLAERESVFENRRRLGQSGLTVTKRADSHHIVDVLVDVDVLLSVLILQLLLLHYCLCCP